MNIVEKVSDDLQKAPKAKFTIEDAQRASDVWVANCGPGAIAAICGMTLDEVRPYMGDFERKYYTNPTLMWQTLNRIGRPWHKVPHDEYLPWWGLLRIQWEGPWTKPGVPMRARYRHTHWIGVCNASDGSEHAFDINCMSVGGWVSWREWCDKVCPWLIKEGCPKGDGKWHITHAVSVAKKDLETEGAGA